MHPLRNIIRRDLCKACLFVVLLVVAALFIFDRLHFDLVLGLTHAFLTLS